MTPPDRPDDRTDPERDAWLREALRHAPDAQAMPPASVSDAILRQARAAARAPAPGAATGSPRGRWAQAWAWLARPPVAAGFASVLVATLVGLMWWDQPMDPRERPSPTAAEAPPRRDATPASTREAQPPAAAPAPAKKPAPARSTPQPAQAVPPPAAPDAFPAPAPPADGATAARDEAGAPVAASPRRAPALEGQDQRAASAKVAADANAAPVTRPAAWAAALASIDAEPQRWHWQRNGLAQPMSPALQRWLAQFDAATAGRWRHTDATAPAQVGRVLRLYRDGAPFATLRFDAEHAWFTPDTHAAGLPAASVDRLLKDLDGAAP